MELTAHSTHETEWLQAKVPLAKTEISNVQAKSTCTSCEGLFKTFLETGAGSQHNRTSKFPSAGYSVPCLWHAVSQAMEVGIKEWQFLRVTHMACCTYCRRGAHPSRMKISQFKHARMHDKLWRIALDRDGGAWRAEHIAIICPNLHGGEGCIVRCTCELKVASHHRNFPMLTLVTVT